MPDISALKLSDWVLLFLGIAIAATLSQGVHDLAIEHLGIPYPHDMAVPAWAKYLNDAVRMAGTTILFRTAAPSLERRNPWLVAAATGALIAALDEALRVIVIEWAILDGWQGYNGTYVLIDRAPAILVSFYRGAMAAMIARHVRDLLRSALTILAASLFGYLVVSPVLRAAGPALWAALGTADPAPLYLPPYDRHLLPFIYGMFVEPTIAALLMAMLVWPRLGRSAGRRVGLFLLLLLILRGRMVTQFVYSFWLALPLPLAFAAEAQFFFETALLALLTGVLCEWVYRRSGQSSKA